MKAARCYPELVRDILFRPTEGVSRVFDDLLVICRLHGLNLEWEGEGCRIRSIDGETDEVIDVPLPKSVFRSILARLATLCNEHGSGTVPPHGGRGEFSVDAIPRAVFKIRFSNTPDVQKLELQSEVSEPLALPRLGEHGESKAPAYRAWVMIKRNRSERFYQAEMELEELAKDEREHKGIIKHLYSFYGEYDLLIPLEGNSLAQIQKAVTMIQRRGGEAVFSTITSVVVDPAFDNVNRFRDRQVCMGIITQLGSKLSVRKQLEQLDYFDLADIVFGEFDIIALFHPGETGALNGLRTAIREVQSIQKTTTMLPHKIALL